MIGHLLGIFPRVVLLDPAVKNNDILNFACKWMEIENTILSEITQTQKGEYGMYSLINGL